jgi:trimeric autotransporter adhesin
MNVIMGSDAGSNITTGYNNTFFGNLAGYSTTTGDYNIFAGSEAGYTNTIGNQNVYLGNLAGTNATGYYNTVVGNNAGKVINEDYNTMMGSQTGNKTTTGRGNAFFGHEAGHENITGDYNTYVGPGTGYNNTSGSYNVFIGRYAGFSETGSNKLYIDNNSNSSTGALIYGDFSTGQLRFNANVSIGTSQYLSYRLTILGSAYASGGVWSASDIRLKQNVRSMDGDGVLDKMKDMEVIKYNYVKGVTSNNEADTSTYIGVIAQEIEKSFPEVVRTNEDGFKAVNYGALTAILFQAIKDQQKQIDALKQQIELMKTGK